MIPTSTQVSVAVKSSPPAGGTDAIVVFAIQGAGEASGASRLGSEDRKSVARILGGGAARGKAREIGFDLVEVGRGYRRVYVAGLGVKEKLSTESIRQAAGAVIKALRKHRLAKAALVVPELPGIGADAAAEALVVGALLAAFDYEEYRGTGAKRNNDEDGDAKHAPRRFELTIVSANLAAAKSGVERGRALGDAQNFARTIASRPGNNINPPSLAKVAQSMAREAGLGVRVLDEKEMARLGMGGILGVGAGSIATPPRLIVLEYNGIAKRSGKRGGAPSKSSGGGADRPLLVVGKAITFDTGGISIKPAEKMGKMIFDKCGGMAVLGLMYALAKLKWPVHVVGILSSAENALSSKAYRPGDILRLYNGVTVEVTNTDAEGRLVLGDALAWGIETYRPAAVVDLATLTGGVITALGKTMAGVMSNSDELVKELNEAGEVAGERMWRLPLGDDQRDYIKSEFADIVNSAGREGHPLQGGAFLSYFVPADGSVPWAHLDIAGVADTEKELPYYAKGATGWGIRTLVEWVRRRSSAG